MLLCILFFSETFDKLVQPTNQIYIKYFQRKVKQLVGLKSAVPLNPLYFGESLSIKICQALPLLCLVPGLEYFAAVNHFSSHGPGRLSGICCQNQLSVKT